MKSNSFRWALGVPALAACVLAGCGDGTDVKLVDVPPVTPATPQPAKSQATSRIPKNARFSPTVLPGDPPK